MNNTQKHGFTLIEIVVVIGIIGLLIPIFFNIIFTILREQVKIVRLVEVKNQGDFVMATLKTTIQNNAVIIASDNTLSSLVQKCNDSPPFPRTYIPTSSANFYLGDSKNNWFKFDASTGNKIASNSALTNADLTTSKVRVENFIITCTRTDYFTTPTINIQYDICYNKNTACSTVDRPEESAVLHYQSRIKLRNL